MIGVYIILLIFAALFGYFAFITLDEAYLNTLDIFWAIFWTLAANACFAVGAINIFIHLWRTLSA